jgi:SNF2 family DNA or RNA helicase
MMKLSQMTSGFMNDENGDEVVIGQSKLNLLCEVVSEIKRDEPLVIFARFKRDIAQIKTALGKVGYKVAELSGSRNEWREWRQGKFQVIVVQLQAGGVGINFTKCGEKQCKYCIYYGKDFNWGNYKQSIKRIHRPGQKETTIFITLVMDDTIDEKIEKVLESRGNLVEAIVNARSFKRAETGVEKTQTESDDDDDEVAGGLDTWGLMDEVNRDLGELLVAGGYVRREELD